MTTISVQPWCLHFQLIACLTFSHTSKHQPLSSINHCQPLLGNLWVQHALASWITRLIFFESYLLVPSVIKLYILHYYYHPYNSKFLSNFLLVDTMVKMWNFTSPTSFYQHWATGLLEMLNPGFSNNPNAKYGMNSMYISSSWNKNWHYFQEMWWIFNFQCCV